MTVLILTHLAAVFLGAWFGFLISGILLRAKLADLQREIAELRTELDASSFFARFPDHPHKPPPESSGGQNEEDDT
jgi:hypothetical protein